MIAFGFLRPPSFSKNTLNICVHVFIFILFFLFMFLKNESPCLPLHTKIFAYFFIFTLIKGTKIKKILDLEKNLR